MGPGPRSTTFPYHRLWDSTPLHGPWADHYGRTIGDIRDDLVVVRLPGLAKDLYIHERVLPAFNRVLENLASYAPPGETYHIGRFTWSYDPAVIPGGRRLSFHGVGASIDINSDRNPFSDDPTDWVTDMPEWFVDAWRDAGWCWGGDWVSVKDPMHFSYMGPLHEPGGSNLRPYPPNTAASTFSRSVTVDTALDGAYATDERFAIDLDRDGAPDIVRIHLRSTGGFVLEAAESWSDFGTCSVSGRSQGGVPRFDGLGVGDATGDGRPELWSFDESGPRVVATTYSVVDAEGGFSHVTWHPAVVDTIVTNIDSGLGGRYLVGDHDRDGIADLYVVAPGTPTVLQIWRGPHFRSTIVSRTLPFGSAETWQFGLGDHDVDGIVDLYALSSEPIARLIVTTGASGFAGAPIGIKTATSLRSGDRLSVEDYDGDGRDDLYLIDPMGDARVVLGGVRSLSADLTGWFVDRDTTWQPGEGCLHEPYEDIVDPSFEGGSLASSIHSFTRRGGTWSTSASDARSGSQAAVYDSTGQTGTALLSVHGSPSSPADHVVVEPGDTMAFSVWVRADAGATNRIRPRIRFYDDEGTLLQSVKQTPTRASTAWQHIGAVGVAPRNAAYATFRLEIRADGRDGRYVFDDLDLRRNDTRRADGFDDPGFEFGEIGSPHVFRGGGGGWTMDAGSGRDGSRSARFDATGQHATATLAANGPPGDGSSHLAVSAGDLVDVTAWVVADPGATNGVKPRLKFYNADGRKIAVVKASATTPTARWHQVGIGGLAPPGTAFVVFQLRIRADGMRGSYYVDDLVRRLG